MRISPPNPNPLAPHADGILAHVNSEHTEALALCCRAFTRAADTEAAALTGVDRYGFEMSASTAAGPRPLRLGWSGEVHGRGRPSESSSSW
ncbi:MAG: DUF2470 domain-containing protein [Deltaproteobacteria bacterium]|nr:DUF2470 domain-containing protein [Deltaproteobacteria bacterium]